MRRVIHNLIKTLIVISSAAVASPFTHEFSNPSFQGNAGSHWLSIEEKLLKKKAEVKNKKDAATEREAALAKKTNVAKFFKNVEARIYAQLSKQLVDQMFGETSQSAGTIEIEGNTLTYIKDGDNVTLTVVSEDGTATTLIIPINSFTF
jgi:hypothetical protein